MKLQTHFELAFVSTIIEKAVNKQIDQHYDENNLHQPMQSAYMIHFSESALIRVLNAILMAMNNRTIVLVTLLYLSAAFDNVTHNILLERLHTRFGQTGVVQDWFHIA